MGSPLDLSRVDPEPKKLKGLRTKTISIIPTGANGNIGNTGPGLRLASELGVTPKECAVWGSRPRGAPAEGASQAAALPEARFPKRRTPISLPPPTPLPSLNPGPVLPICPFAPVGITDFLLVRGLSNVSDSGFRSTLKTDLRPV